MLVVEYIPVLFHFLLECRPLRQLTYPVLCETRLDVDERFDMAQSTRAACAYLQDARNRCGSWTAAAAAYNMGYGGYNKTAAAQNSNSDWDLYLNAETARYVYRILAIKCIFKQPEVYGIHLRMKDLYQPLATDTLGVDSAINNLYRFALEHGCSYKELKTFNPWLRGTSLPNAVKKHYVIALPQKEALNYRKTLRHITPDAFFKGR